MSDKKQLIIIGAGPAGYTAAFHAADLGLDVTLIEQAQKLGGVCLNRGCIPSKALLHVAKLINDAHHAQDFGITFGSPKIDLDTIRSFKDTTIEKLTGGLTQLCKQRKITHIQGKATFLDSETINVLNFSDGTQSSLSFEKAILATGSQPIGLDFANASDKIWYSVTALDIPKIPKSLLVIGGGYIGMELASVYHALGSVITIVEMTSSLLPGADRDMVMPLTKKAKQNFSEIKLNTQVTAMKETDTGVNVTFEDAKGAISNQEFENVLVAVGRKNVFDGLGLEKAGVTLAENKKFISVNAQRQTNVSNIYAIGDITEGPMLAHKGSAEGLVAAKNCAGQDTSFNPKAIPAVVFTDPEIAWCGLTETQAKEQGLDITVSKFPWAASGRAVTLNRTDGITKIITDAASQKILGIALSGPGAGDLISEGALAIEMGATAKDIAHTIHPHPTLSETIMESAEGIFGSPTHIYRRK